VVVALLLGAALAVAFARRDRNRAASPADAENRQVVPS